MATISHEKLERIIQRFATVEHGLSSGTGGEAFVKLSKEYADLEPTARAALALKKAYDEGRDLDDMIKAGGEMAGMAEAERPEIDAKIETMEHDIRILLLPKDAADERMSSSNCAPGLAATRRRFSLAICSACTSAMRRRRAGRSR